MTTYLKYYARENTRHAVAEKVKADFATVVEMSKALFKHFRVPAIPVQLMDKKIKEFRRQRKAKSWYQPGGFIRKAKIVYHPTMLSALTVAHEVAHYVDDVRKKQAKVRRVRWHSADHRRLTDQGVLALQEKFAPMFQPGYVALTPTPGLPVEVEVSVATLIAQKINQFYATLAEKLTCPCCNATIPKMNFGVRVMKRDAAGIPLVIRRQSYCKACR